MDTTAEEKSFYSFDEIVNAIEVLTPKELVTLREYARSSLCWSGRFCEPDDLINEAIQRCLEDRRHWNKKLPVLQSIIGIMKSIASEASNLMLSGDNQVDFHLEEIVDVVRCDQSPDKEIYLLELEKKTFEAFESDPFARALLKGRLDGLSRGEIIDQTSMSPKEYQAAAKRISRWVLAQNLASEG